jgi:hypothetical protein
VTSCGKLLANSTHSTARKMLPSASSLVLPFSSMMVAARRSTWASISAFIRKRTWTRSFTGVAPHAACASAARTTAASSSAAVDIGTSAMTSPVVGLVTGRVLFDGLVTDSPPT